MEGYKQSTYFKTGFPTVKITKRISPVDALKYQLPKLRKREIADSLTQTDIAKKLKTRQPQIARWENSPGQLTVKNLMRLAAASGYNVSIDFYKK